MIVGMISRTIALACLLCTPELALAENGDVVRIGDLWRYHKSSDNASVPDADWHKRDFDDSRWRFARSGLELSDEEEGFRGKGGPGYMYQRRTFTVRNPRPRP